MLNGLALARSVRMTQKTFSGPFGQDDDTANACAQPIGERTSQFSTASGFGLVLETFVCMIAPEDCSFLMMEQLMWSDANEKRVAKPKRFPTRGDQNFLNLF